MKQEKNQDNAENEEIVSSSFIRFYLFCHYSYYYIIF